MAILAMLDFSIMLHRGVETVWAVDEYRCLGNLISRTFVVLQSQAGVAVANL
jgi:hypothetical protein